MTRKPGKVPVRKREELPLQILTSKAPWNARSVKRGGGRDRFRPLPPQCLAFAQSLRDMPAFCPLRLHKQVEVVRFVVYALSVLSERQSHSCITGCRRSLLVRGQRKVIEARLPGRIRYHRQ